MIADFAATSLNRCTESSPPNRSGFQVGGVSVELSGNRSTDITLVPTLELFRSISCVSDIRIRVEWVNELCPTPGRQLFDSGALWQLYEGEAGFQFDFNVPILGEQPYRRLLIDNYFRQATLQMNQECFVNCPYAAEPLEYPLDELLIMHRLTQESAIELHGCGIVGPNGASNLFVGHSGAGKSTTTRLWMAQHDVEILSDDRIIVRRDEVGCAGAVGAPSTALGTSARGSNAAQAPQLRLRNCSASRSSYSARDDKVKTAGQMRMYGTPWHGEAAFASPASAPLSRILILEHGYGNVLTRLSKSQAVAELFARSFVPFHRHEYVDSALSFLEQVADSVPCYRYSFEPDARAVEKILNFRD